ncbi:tripartite tricarboxylate transporter substrate-binding protein [Cupriavidus necator]
MIGTRLGAVLIQGGRLKPLAMAARHRLKMLPNVPTYAEAGLPAMNNPSRIGLGAPAGTSPAIFDRINAAVKQALAEPEVIAAIEKQGAIPACTTRKAFADPVRTQNRKRSSRTSISLSCSKELIR